MNARESPCLGLAAGLDAAAVAPACAGAEPERYSAGANVYRKAELPWLFLWLLFGDLVFTLIDQIEPKVLPPLLRDHAATNSQIAFIVGSINAAVQLVVMPPLGYISDRTRSRLGRRIPFLLVAAPIASVFLAATAYAPELARWCGGAPWMLWAAAWSPVVVAYALLVFLYRFFEAGVNCMYFGLVTDVVPPSHMGRFLSLFRVVGAVAAFVITYWFVGMVEGSARELFVGVALFNLVGFGLVCHFVRERQPRSRAPDATRGTRGRGRLAAVASACANFVRESFCHRVYLWTYVVRVCLYGAQALLSFVIFFPNVDLHIGLAAVGRLMAWPAVAWIVVAFHVGRWLDALGSIRLLKIALRVTVVSYGLGFLWVSGPKSFFVFSLVTGVAFWVVMLSQLKLIQEVFHPDRYSQLAGACTIVQSIGIAVLICPVAGWLLDEMKFLQAPLHVPVLGSVLVGQYRIITLLLMGLYGLAWFALRRLERHWRLCGGPDRYVAPL